MAAVTFSVSPADAAQHLAACAERHRDDEIVGEYYRHCHTLYTKKLWHQLSEKLLELVELPRYAERQSDELLSLYNQCVREFEHRLNPLSLARLLVVVAAQYPAQLVGCEFLEASRTKVKRSANAQILLVSTCASLQLAAGQPAACKPLLAEAKQLLDSASPAEHDAAERSIAFRAFYRASYEYHKRVGTSVQFYDAAMLYLAYTDVDAIAPARRVCLAADLCVAAVAGDTIYNFLELLSHPVLECLRGTEREWTHRLVLAFSAGNMDEYRKFVAAHDAQLTAEPALASSSARDALAQKIAILSLLELVSGRAADDRTLTFDEIAAHVRVDVAQVEQLVMRAMSVKLIRGHIDQAGDATHGDSGVVVVTWVQPRYMGVEQVAAMCARLSNWQSTVQSTLMLLESETTEIIA